MKNITQTSLFYTQNYGVFNYPFGMELEGRTFDNTEYKHGFNGQIKDNEIYGEGNAYDFGERIYDSRIARFMTTDPLIVNQQKYCWLSPYQFAGNSPIANIDLDGLENVYYGDAMKLKGFASSSSLMLSTDEGIQAQTKIWNTENSKIKHDVYFVPLNAQAYSKITSGSSATISFKNDHISKKGDYVSTSKNGEKLNFNNTNVTSELSKLNFSNSVDGNKIIHVVFINASDFIKSTQEEQALTIFHELKSHINSLIGNEKNVYEDTEIIDHFKFHGKATETSPNAGDESPNTPQSRFIYQMKKSSFNKKNKQKK